MLSLKNLSICISQIYNTYRYMCSFRTDNKHFTLYIAAALTTGVIILYRCMNLLTKEQTEDTFMFITGV